MSRKRKPNSRRPGAGRPSVEDPDQYERVEFNGGSLTLDGRRIEMSTNRSLEQQAELLAGLRARLPLIEADLDAKMDRLDELLLEAGPESCVASMTEDIGVLIGEAADQHQRLATALTDTNPAALGFVPGHEGALDAPWSLDVIVTLDDVTVWSTHTHKLTDLVQLGSPTRFPWVLSIADLMATTDLLTGGELAHYLTRRQRIEHEGRLEANDELDWVGHYIAEGLFFDDLFADDTGPDVMRLLSYTEPIDTWYYSRGGKLQKEVDRPQQLLDPRLRDFLNRLERDRPDLYLPSSART